MKFFFLFFLLFFSDHFLHAQKHLQFDSSKMDVRSFNNQSLERLRQDKDFQYDRYREPPKSLWERFWSWVWYTIDRIMQSKGGRTTVYAVLIVFAVAAIVFFVMKITGMTGGGIFGRNAGRSMSYTVSDDDIHAISFDDAIQQAVNMGNFRLAIRLLYLQALKNLSDKGYIDWQINKTNSDYIQEVVSRPWHSLFQLLTWRFEYTWYGERNMEKDDFNKLQLQFQQFNNQLQ